jgi:hypothetical protein
VKPIQAAKAAVRTEELAERLTGPGQRRGSSAEIAFVCPLHDDHEPSLRVDPERGVWYCDPCAVGGDVVELARRAWGYPDDGRGAAEAAAFLLLEFGHELPQRPQSWFARQERQKPMRDAIEEARIEVMMRRLWRYVFEPIVTDIEDPDERVRMADQLWRKVLPRVIRLAEDREGTE